jgi:L-alanine-DL-glutamate epimerase-like enolase superfamily enzyme
MVDVGTAWNDDVARATERLHTLQEVNAYWLEEPFVNMALNPYKALSQAEPRMPLAGGEGCNNYVQAAAMIEHAGIGFVQIDTGRIGGITVAKQVADLAQQKGVTFVNHTFTSHLALSASVQPYAGVEKDLICEYPFEPKSLALDITREKILLDENGMISLPEKPGLGMSVDTERLKKYLLEVEIKVKGETLYTTPIL